MKSLLIIFAVFLLVLASECLARSTSLKRVHLWQSMAKTGGGTGGPNGGGGDNGGPDGGNGGGGDGGPDGGDGGPDGGNGGPDGGDGGNGGPNGGGGNGGPNGGGGNGGPNGGGGNGGPNGGGGNGGPNGGGGNGGPNGGGGGSGNGGPHGGNGGPHDGNGGIDFDDFIESLGGLEEPDWTLILQEECNIDVDRFMMDRIFEPVTPGEVISALRNVSAGMDSNSDLLDDHREDMDDVDEAFEDESINITDYVHAHGNLFRNFSTVLETIGQSSLCPSMRLYGIYLRLQMAGGVNFSRDPDCGLAVGLVDDILREAGMDLDAAIHLIDREWLIEYGHHARDDMDCIMSDMEMLGEKISELADNEPDSVSLRKVEIGLGTLMAISHVLEKEIFEFMLSVRLVGYALEHLEDTAIEHPNDFQTDKYLMAYKKLQELLEGLQREIAF